ncbi:MAG TPA: DUF1735 and LamG domain-containing protein [Puia sp.]|jgi:hypothetical protein
MHKIKYIIALLVLVGGLAGGCKKATQYNDVVYFTGTEQSPTTKFTVDGPAGLGVTVTASTKVIKDVTVSMKIDSSLLAAFNKTNGTTYTMPPTGSYTLSTGTVVIPSGTNISQSAEFNITSIANFQQGIIYCVPITITSVNGIGVLEASRTLYVLINQTIITPAATLVTNYFTVPKFQTDPTLASVSKITMECRVFVNKFQTVNPFISSIIGIEENFLLRFGDVAVANNQVELAGGLLNGNKYPVAGNTLFSTGTWYHVAVVYNGSTISVYVNGVLDNYTVAEAGGINLTDTYSGGFHIGYSADGRLTNGYVSEARVWTTALTSAQLINNLCYVDPTSKDLLAYWRLNSADASGNVTDLTGHGYTAVGFKPVVFIQGVRCPN